jgi:hypothetical protein
MVAAGLCPVPLATWLDLGYHQVASQSRERQSEIPASLRVLELQLSSTLNVVVGGVFKLFAILQHFRLSPLGTVSYFCVSVSAIMAAALGLSRTLEFSFWVFIALQVKD